MKLHKCSFANNRFNEARKRAEEGCKGRTEKEVQEEISKALREVKRMLIQGTLGVGMARRRKYQKNHGGNQSKTEHLRKGKRPVCRYSWKEQDKMERGVLDTRKLWKEEKVITLTGLQVFPGVGESGVGTLEVHVNGFYYRASTRDFCFRFFYADVKQAFFRAEDEKMSPLLHFQFYHRIKVGTEKRRNIQFRFVQKRSYNDSECSRKVEILKNFVQNVREKWGNVPVLHCCAFREAEVRKADEFQGNCPSKSPTIFGMTFSALVGLVNEPFVVIELDEIEIVNLSLKLDLSKPPDFCKPVEIDMTIVFKDFKREPVQISSIPGDKLDLIKDRCNFAGVKYYDNLISPESVVTYYKRQIADSPLFLNWLLLERLDTVRHYASHPVYGGLEGEAYCRSDEEGEESYRLED